jgi:hypothetical protein
VSLGLTNVEKRKFSEMLEHAIKAYWNRSLEAALVVMDCSTSPGSYGTSDSRLCDRAPLVFFFIGRRHWWQDARAVPAVIVTRPWDTLSCVHDWEFPTGMEPTGRTVTEFSQGRTAPAAPGGGSTARPLAPATS